VHKRGLRLVNIISRSVKELVNAGGAIMAKIIGIDLGTSNSCAAVMLVANLQSFHLPKELPCTARLCHRLSHSPKKGKYSWVNQPEGRQP